MEGYEIFVVIFGIVILLIGTYALFAKKAKREEQKLREIYKEEIEEFENVEVYGTCSSCKYLTYDDEYYCEMGNHKVWNPEYATCSHYDEKRHYK